MLALIKNDEYVSTHRTGSKVKAGENVVMPAMDGWSHGDYSLHLLIPADPVPEGKRIVDTRILNTGEGWKTVHTLEDTSEPTPEEIRENMPPLTARQLRLGLVSASILPAQVDAAIAAIPDEQARAVAEIEWEYATQFERNHPLIDQVGTALGLSPEQIDAMWMTVLEL